MVCTAPIPIAIICIILYESHKKFLQFVAKFKEIKMTLEMTDEHWKYAHDVNIIVYLYLQL